MNSTTSVFVYGTLLFSEVTDRLGIRSIDPVSGSEITIIRRDATLRGYRRFTVQLRETGNFPAIVLADDVVEGHLLLHVSDESLQRLDEFEGIEDGYYTRDEVVVRCDGEDAIAFAYVCGSPLQDHLDGAWNPEAFRQSGLGWYLQNVVR